MKPAILAIVMVAGALLPLGAHGQQIPAASLCGSVAVDALHAVFANRTVHSRFSESDGPLAAECAWTLSADENGGTGELTAVLRIFLPSGAADAGRRLHWVQASPFSNRSWSEFGGVISSFRLARDEVANGELRITASKGKHSLALLVHSASSPSGRSEPQPVDETDMKRAIAFAGSVLDEISSGSERPGPGASILGDQAQSADAGYRLQNVAAAPK